MCWIFLAGWFLLIVGAAVYAEALEGTSEPQNGPLEGRTDHRRGFPSS